MPLLYLGAAHVSLIVACVSVALWPQAAAGFFYHAWLIGLVHLVTLGWISFSIIGAMYIVAPLALRTELMPRRLDYVAFGFAGVGLAGMVSHFWVQQFDGMAWSASGVAAAIFYMTLRIVSCVRRAPIQPAVKLHIVLACMNFWIAASMGLLIAFDKVFHFLPGFVLANVFAHAHLAALGWAAMMVIGVAYRLLPMILPARMPAGRSLYLSAVLLEIGVLGLFAALLTRSRTETVFAVFVILAFAAFGTHVVWMARHPALRPRGAPRVDFAVLHAGLAGVSLAAACVVGIALVSQPPSDRLLRAAAAYGVLGLVGFLAQMVIAMEARLLPMVTWYWAYTASGYRVVPPSPHAMADRHLQALVFAGWAAGVPLLATGMFRASPAMTGIAASMLAAAMLLVTLDHALVLAKQIFTT